MMPMYETPRMASASAAAAPAANPPDAMSSQFGTEEVKTSLLQLKAMIDNLAQHGVSAQTLQDRSADILNEVNRLNASNRKEMLDELERKMAGLNLEEFDRRSAVVANQISKLEGQATSLENRAAGAFQHQATKLAELEEKANKSFTHQEGQLKELMEQVPAKMAEHDSRLHVHEATFKDLHNKMQMSVDTVTAQMASLGTAGHADPHQVHLLVAKITELENRSQRLEQQMSSSSGHREGGGSKEGNGISFLSHQDMKPKTFDGKLAGWRDWCEQARGHFAARYPGVDDVL